METKDRSPAEITQLLKAWGGGDKSALDALLPVVHKELRRQAHRYMLRERGGGLQTTELVNEVYLKLVDSSRVGWQDRAHFFAISAQLMRRVLVDMARSRRYAKRGGDAIRVTLQKALEAPEIQAPDWIALNDALDTLQTVDARKCRMVELRFFCGLSVEETAEALQVSPDTIARDWRFVKTWLRRELSGNPES
ncbi:MAG: sigma-70 family RNA polymerase sigma factor [Bryobacteraceae bacterium]